MKYLLIFLIAFLFIENMDAQSNKTMTDCASYNDSITKRKIYTYVDKMPEYDCKIGFLINLTAEIIIDSIPENLDTRGAVSFIVETNGEVKNIRIIDSINNKIDKQIIEFFKKSNKWKAGYCNGVVVPVEITVPYQFEYK